VYKAKTSAGKKHNCAGGEKMPSSRSSEQYCTMTSSITTVCKMAVPTHKDSTFHIDRCMDSALR